MRLPKRASVVEVVRPPLKPHEFVQSDAAIRRFGAPMSNPPAPEDFVRSPLCAKCRRYRNDPIHEVNP